eukprot:3173586-Pleurochrysis_carterae.AAC.2
MRDSPNRAYAHARSSTPVQKCTCTLDHTHTCLTAEHLSSYLQGYGCMHRPEHSFMSTSIYTARADARLE